MPASDNDNSVLYHLDPTVTVTLATGQAAVTGTSPIKFKVAFNKPATDVFFDAGSVSVSTGSGTAFFTNTVPPTVPQITVAPDPTDTKAFIVTVAGMNDDGA